MVGMCDYGDDGEEKEEEQEEWKRIRCCNHR